MNNRPLLLRLLLKLLARRLGLSFAAPLGVLVLCSGCMATGGKAPEGNNEPDLDLIYGVSIFGGLPTEEIAAVLPPDEVLNLTPEMRAFTRKLVGRSLPPLERAKRLVHVLVRKDFFPKGYYTEHTRTASEVYDKRSGNCLSYTNLFVAMARELGIRAHFQFARIPPSWTSDSGYLVRSRHINVLVSDKKLSSSNWVTIDFNKVASASIYPSKPVSDAFALSSYYNNLAVDKLYTRDYKSTVALLAQAIEIEPNNSDAWVNLAAVYSKHNKDAETQAAFEAALRAEPGHESALAGLARLYRDRGKLETAAIYTNEIRSRRERDPYFQFATAQAAYENKAYEKSLKHIDKAIELRARGSFFYLKALVHYARNELSMANTSLKQAQDRKRTLPSKKQEHALLLAQRINAQTAIDNGLVVPTSR